MDPSVCAVPLGQVQKTSNIVDDVRCLYSHANALQRAREGGKWRTSVQASKPSMRWRSRSREECKTRDVTRF